MKLRRTLLTAGVCALLAMVYVPTPHRGYRLIFSSDDTSIAFFQLLLNVGFAALLGAILATIVPNISRRTLFLTAGCIAVVALGVGVFAFCQAAAIRAQGDEQNGEEMLVLYPTDLQWTLTKFRNAATNWRLALRFDEAVRVENRIKALQKHPAQDWRSDPVVDLSDLPDQSTGQDFQSSPAPASGPWEDFQQAPAQAPEASAQGKPVPTPTKYISTDPKAGEPIPRARSVKKSMFDDLIPARTATPGR